MNLSLAIFPFESGSNVFPLLTELGRLSSVFRAFGLICGFGTCSLLSRGSTAVCLIDLSLWSIYTAHLLDTCSVEI